MMRSKCGSVPTERALCHAETMYHARDWCILTRMTISHSPIVAATALALAALLAACSPSAPASSHTAPAATSPTPASDEAAYLAALHPLGLDGTDAQSISLARTICADLDASQPMSDLIASIVNSGAMTEADTRTVVRAAIVNYCPSHKDIAPAA